jgi:hypothetical protein
MECLTLEGLKQKRAEGLLASEKAIQRKYDTYQDVKKILTEINTKPLDVVNYYPTARRLGLMLREMTTGYANTIFHYFADHIDPLVKGDVRCFRMECFQLAEQLKELDHRRLTRCGLKIIK